MANLSTSAYLWLMTVNRHINAPLESIDSFQKFVEELGFPCVGAKAAMARKQIKTCLADDIRNASSDNKIVAELQGFAASCNEESLFVSFAVIFENSPTMNEIEFEKFLWQRLQAIHDIDVVNYSWDKKVSSDVTSSDFSLSIGGKGFYIVGLHPNASRSARQFSKPTLIFNLHSQFELLRGGGSYARIRDTILERDKKLSGDINPMLAQHGEASEARQYSGRVLENEWNCPFHANKQVTHD